MDIMLSASSPVFLPRSAPKAPQSKSNIFFNPKISIPDLKKISLQADVNDLFTNWNSTFKKYSEWVSSKSPQIVTSSCKKKISFPFILTPPPGFEQVKPAINLSDFSTGSESSPTIDRLSHCKISENDVKLKLPNSGVSKREQRGIFDEEKVSYERYDGEVKFYQLKKRFGFVMLDEDKSDVFLCEDDLVLSGVNIKKFKEAVFKKVCIRMNFLIKFYYENEVQKRKAVDVRLISELN